MKSINFKSLKENIMSNILKPMKVSSIKWINTKSIVKAVNKVYDIS